MMAAAVTNLVARPLRFPALLKKGLANLEQGKSFRIVFLDIRSVTTLHLLVWAATENACPRQQRFGDALKQALRMTSSAPWLLVLRSFGRIARSNGWHVDCESVDDLDLIVAFVCPAEAEDLER